jgi:lipid II:glycine glycyltransferase (peptidoglycan interpeptide bridge formation enzyme)
MTTQFSWKTNLTPKEWDTILTSAAGHPLQSATWGQAHRRFRLSQDHYWMAYYEEQPVFLVRFEERRYAGFIKIAWVPRGPIVIEPFFEAEAMSEFLKKLKQRKFMFCVSFPWKSIEPLLSESLPQTIWLDLSPGKEEIWKQTNKGFRYSVKQSQQQGLSIATTQNKDSILKFFLLCETLSRKKKFTLKMSPSLLENLLKTRHCEQLECHLFIADLKLDLCGGAFIIRCGENIHYLWGAVDRKHSTNKTCVGEALQWAIIEWAIEKKCRLYDLEGIDIKNNFGVYQFKNKLKGKIVSLPGLQIFPLHTLAKIALSCLNNLKFIAKLIFR